MTLLVTGATGLVGSHLCTKLVSEGYRVMGLVHERPNPTIESLLKHNNFKTFTVDIRNTKAVGEIFQNDKIKTVFHTASHVPYTPCMDKDLRGVNVLGTFNLLKAAHRGQITDFIYTSSASVYSDPPSYLPVDELHPTEPSSLYGMSKLTGELACGPYAESMKVTILRYAGVYGTNSEKHRAINNFIRCAINNQPLTVDSDGEQSSDFVYVDDVIQGTYLAWAKQDSWAKQNPRVYNIGSGQETTLKELAKLIIELTNSKSEIVTNGNKVDRPFRFFLDIAAAKRDLGYSPHLLRDGLLSYIREGGW